MRSFKYVATIVLLAIFITGCADNNEANQTNQSHQNPLDPNRNGENNPEADNKLGYVKYTKEELNNSTAEDKRLGIDRNETADNITRTILHNDLFSEAATLVTDQEVLIAYDKNEEADSDRTRNIAKQSAASMIPRYYEVYASDDNTLIKDIESLHNSSTSSDDYSKTLERIINEMEDDSNTR